MKRKTARKTRFVFSPMFTITFFSILIKETTRNSPKKEREKRRHTCTCTLYQMCACAMKKSISPPTGQVCDSENSPPIPHIIASGGWWGKTLIGALDPSRCDTYGRGGSFRTNFREPWLSSAGSSPTRYQCLLHQPTPH